MKATALGGQRIGQQPTSIKEVKVKNISFIKTVLLEFVGLM